MDKPIWTKTINGNYVLEISEKEAVSFRDHNEPSLVSDLLPMFDAIVGKQSTNSETALVNSEGYRILIGDWREAYGKLAGKPFADFLTLYEANKAEHGSTWTTPGL